MASVITLEWSTRAPAARIFDLARSIDAHVASTPGTEERPVPGRDGRGKTTGLLELGDEVTWRARHFGVMQELTSRITAFDRPRHFRDAMVRGAFRRFDHDHFFAPDGEITRCRDVFAFEAPLGPLGWVAERLFLERYMRRFLEARIRILQHLAARPTCDP